MDTTLVLPISKKFMRGVGKEGVEIRQGKIRRYRDISRDLFLDNGFQYPRQ